MHTTRGKRPRAIGHSLAERNGKKGSFRNLKAFGMWRNRADLKDPVEFTTELRARTERPIDLLGAAAVRRQIPIATLNEKHFKALPGVKVVRPY